MFRTTALCGSMRFTKEMITVQSYIGKKGYICLLPVFDLEDDGQKISPELKEMYKFMHFQRIDMSESIHVVMVDGYIGYSTQLELDYARKNNKKIIFVELKDNQIINYIE